MYGLANEVVVALISLIGTLGVASLATWNEMRKAKNTLLELETTTCVLNPEKLIEDFGAIIPELQILMATTRVDRFLILTACNGTHVPEWTTAIFQFRDSGQEYVNYVNFRLDQDYVRRLRELEYTQGRHYPVKNMPEDSAIRYVYESEGVQDSAWFFLGSQQVTDKKRAVAYCSFATHSPELLTDEEITRCRIIADRISALLMWPTL